MSARTPLVLSLLATSALSQASDTSGFMQWIETNLFKRINITGRRQLGFHMHQVEGDIDAYNSTTYYGLGGKRFTDLGYMNVSGQDVFGVLNFNMTMADNRFHDPQSRRISIDYVDGPYSINLGDVRGSLLNTNRFASFNKQLYGAMGQVKTGRTTFKAVHSETKGSARTVPIQGNNSVGPYYLRASQIIIDSETVQVDGERMRPGIDYVINYEVGSITFTDRIIPPTSTIVATFEVLGFNSDRGTVQGAGATYDLGKYGRVGLTAIEQKTGAARGLSSVIQEFQGYGDPSHEYTLYHEPLTTRPIIIRLNGVIQTEGVHYYFLQGTPSVFFFNFFVPTTSIVSVTYTPKPTQTVDGDRRVVGFDYRLPLSSDGRNYVQYSQASGQLLSGVNPMSGVARGIDANYSIGGFELRAGLRDVPHTFVGIETRGFNRNEKAVDLALEYNKGPLTASASHTNSSISIQRVDNNGDPIFTRSRVSTSRAQANYRPPGGQPWTLEHVRTNSRYQGNENRLDTTSLSTSRTFGKVNTRIALEHQEGHGPISVAGGASTPGALKLDTARLTADYTSGPLTLGARGSLSSIDAAGKKGEGSDISLSGVYEPSDRFRLQTSYNVSNSGQLATLGAFQSGLGLGYEGNGFSPGPTGQPFSTGVTDYRSLSTMANYKIGSRISIDAMIAQTRTSGSVSTNTETQSFGLGLTWNMGAGHLFSMAFDRSDTSFINAVNRSEATTLNAMIAGNPTGPWSYRIGTSVLLSGGNSEYQQDSIAFDAFLSHKIDARQRATLSLQGGNTTGYLPQRDFYAALMYEYQLWGNVSLIGSYKWRKVANNDALLTSGAFRSSGFDLELSFNFGG